MVKQEQRSRSPGPEEPQRCAGCNQPVPADGMAEHLLICSIWAGDAEPDWGCRNCLLVWIGPRGSICPRCMGREIVSFWPSIWESEKAGTQEPEE